MEKKEPHDDGGKKKGGKNPISRLVRRLSGRKKNKKGIQPCNPDEGELAVNGHSNTPTTGSAAVTMATGTIPSNDNIASGAGHAGKDKEESSRIAEFSGGPVPDSSCLDDSKNSNLSGVGACANISPSQEPKPVVTTSAGPSPETLPLVTPENQTMPLVTPENQTLVKEPPTDNPQGGSTGGPMSSQSADLEKDARSSHVSQREGRHSNSDRNSDGDNQTEFRQNNAQSNNPVVKTQIQYIKAKKVQTGPNSVMNMGIHGNAKIPDLGKLRPGTKKPSKPKTALVQHIEAEDVQTGSDSVMTLTVFDKNTRERHDSYKGEGAQAGHEEFLKKGDCLVDTADEIATIHEALKSVARICFNGGVSHGSGFIVGSAHYFFTAWHIVRDIISVQQIGNPTSHDLTKLAGPGVYVDFGTNMHTTQYKYLLKPVVLYHDEDLDVALLQLQENTAEGNAIRFPQSLGKFKQLDPQTKNIVILGHGHPDPQKSKVADKKCEVITNRNPKFIAAKDWFESRGGRRVVIQRLNQSNQYVLPQMLQAPYAKVGDPRHLVCNSFVTKGGSGSPMITTSGEVVGLYNCGIPGFYWSISDGIRDDLKEYVFGCGVKFDAIYESMKMYMVKDLGLTKPIMRDIFPSATDISD